MTDQRSSSGTDGLLIYDQCAQIVRSYGPPCDEHMRAGLLVAIEHFKGLYERQLSVGATTGKPAPERLTPRNIAERLPSSDAAISGAGTPAQADPERIAELQYEAGMYQSLYETAKTTIKRLYAEKAAARDPAYAAVMPIDPPHQAISAAMKEIPEDGCEYEHIEAAYRAIRTSLVSSTDREAPMPWIDAEEGDMS